MSETRIREEICRLGRSLFERGLTPGSSGNISVKLDDGGWLVTPTNASLGSLDPARMSRLGPDGKLVSGDAPTKEVPLHTALYQTRGAARACAAFLPFGSGRCRPRRPAYAERPLPKACPSLWTRLWHLPHRAPRQHRRTLRGRGKAFASPV